MKHYHAVNPDDKCEWTFDEIEECWNTSCGEGFWLETGTPKENGFEYCPYCGRELVEKS
jgi:hypothetical protein